MDADSFAPVIKKLKDMCEKLADAEVSDEACLKAIRQAKKACQSARVEAWKPSVN